MRLLTVLPRILAVFLIILPPLVAASQPVLMQGCDFTMTFYPAGAMVASGLAKEIYPPPSATSFIDAPFNAFTHKLLTYLPRQYVAIYMYPPLVAAVFAPFSKLTPTVALVLWQSFSAAALALVSWLFAGGKVRKMFDYFFMLALFCPIFHTLLIGHLGVVLGLLPLALGYYLLTRDKEIPAGFVWGFLGFKPQFLPCVMLMAGALLAVRRWKTALGLCLGLATFVALSTVALGPDIFISWLHSFKLSDTIFSNPAYGFPEYMVVSLPAVLMQCFPHDARAAAKLPIYSLAALIGFFTLWRAAMLLRKASASGEKEEKDILHRRALAISMSLGLFVLPLVLPHFLFYDMCALSLFCIIAYQDWWSQEEGGIMRATRRLMWWVCNIYYLCFMFAGWVVLLKQWYALSLVLFFAFLYFRILQLSRPGAKV